MILRRIRRRSDRIELGAAPGRHWLLGLLAAAAIAIPLRIAWGGEKTSFDEQVAPLLASRCLDCHNAIDRKGGLDLSTDTGAEKGGDSGRAIEPGQPAKSLLWERVSAGEMPPDDPLDEGERRLIEAWIASGARYEAPRIDRLRYTTDRRAGYDWWSLQPLARPQASLPSGAARGGSPIDAFLLERLLAAGLAPSPPADRRSLIRRLSFDLLGLPPSPGDVEAFLADPAPGAYERLAEKMLASPHYGERWARHWLDVVRFGESQGFERDILRNNAWPYRDWVAAALNADLPYDEFARRQLAGDVLLPGDGGALVATGMLVAGPYDEVGQNQQSAAMKAVVRQDELEDIVSVIGQTFLGLTIHCARCHDHKFDPIRQEEYYRLAAALDGVRHGERELPPDPLEIQTINSSLAAARQELEAIERPAREAVLSERKAGEPLPPPQPIAAWELNGNLKDAIGEMHGEAKGGATLKDGALLLDGRDGFVRTAPLAVELTKKTLEARVKLDNLDHRGGGVISLQTRDGAVFDAIVFGEREPRRWIAGSDHFRRTRDVEGNEETAADAFVHIAVTYAADGTVRLFRNGRPYGKAYLSDGPAKFSAGEAEVLFGLRHSPPGGDKMLAGLIDWARLYDRALSPAEVAASAGTEFDVVEEAEMIARLDEPARLRRQWLAGQIAELEKRLVGAESAKVYAVAPRQPGVSHLLVRGNPAEVGTVVSAGGVAAVAGSGAEFGLPPDAPDAERRQHLAEWVASPQNPLFARVMVNRLWHYHFGRGLVETTSDFGFNGGRPSHPELLDYLAREFVESGFSIKHVQRLIVTSDAYRQSSRRRDEAAEIDAENRLLWRRSVRRLEAEELRDAVLVVAGELNTQVGGPGYHDFRTFTKNTQFYEEIDPIGPEFNRRSLYRTWVRSGRNRLLDVFDCPDPSTKTPSRAETVTPLQSLSVLNHPFMLRMADRFAERVQREAGRELPRQVARVWRLAYGRWPGDEEQRPAEEFAGEHGLPALCRIIFASNEFLHVE